MNRLGVVRVDDREGLRRGSARSATPPAGGLTPAAHDSTATNTMEANWHIGVAGNCIFVIALFSKIIHYVAFADKLVVTRAQQRLHRVLPDISVMARTEEWHSAAIQF
jgi:hypothetical protein